ncbi:MAG: hypothetical protein HDT22_05795 [Ruminococcus sp.]|nr:hypothetical protein [Ruminococcus sp.]
MKYVLYGLPCAGKTTLLSELSIPVIHGSMELNKMASGRFLELSNAERNELRVRYAKNLWGRNDKFISDGHYSFLDDVVFTEADGKLYDVFLYLYCEPEIISKRFKLSCKNSQFANLSTKHIHKWQTFEIESLRAECHKRCKDFYVISDISSIELQVLIDRIENGFGSYRLAKNITEKIQQIYPMPCELHICDGDKTIIEQDSFSVCTDDYVTHIFDGNFYTDYQSLQFSREVYALDYNTDKLSTIQLNDMIYSRIAHKNYFVLSSGIDHLWKMLAEQFELKNVIADTLISADTKYFVVKLLQEKGYTVTAYGDSKNDFYMLKHADTGYLYIGAYLSRSLRDTDTSGIKLLYDKSPYILADVDENTADDISICKSDSGINGSRLADTHIRLGRMLGETIHRFVPNTDTAVIVLDRGGRFFGDGLYTSFGGIFYSYDSKRDKLPKIHHNIAVIVDSVINTGKSILNMIDKLKQFAPEIEIFIATNVIQEKALDHLKEYKIFAVRTSANSFVGSRQAKQNGKGPDTADRLFNYIE